MELARLVTRLDVMPIVIILLIWAVVAEADDIVTLTEDPTSIDTNQADYVCDYNSGLRVRTLPLPHIITNHTLSYTNLFLLNTYAHTYLMNTLRSK